MSDRETKLVDDRLTLTKGMMDDWWLIERAEHDGRKWIEPDGLNLGGGSLMLSARITNADIEGTSEEMEGIALAIRERGQFIARRCAVAVKGERAELRSPRNSIYAASVPLTVADELAAQILKVLVKEKNPGV